MDAQTLISNGPVPVRQVSTLVLSMNVRLDINDHLLSRYGDSLVSEAKTAVLRFTHAAATPEKIAGFIDLHQRISSSFFFILVACRTEGKGRLAKATRSKASRLLKLWNRPVITTIRPVLSISATNLPQLWLNADPCFRREYLNDRLSLPSFWNWVDGTPDARTLVCSLAEYLAKDWESSENAWGYVDEMLQEVPRE